VCIHGADVENAAARLAQLGQCLPDEQVGGDQIDLHHPPEVGAIGGLDVPRMHQGRVVDHRIKPAKRINGHFHQPGRSVGNRQIRDEQHRAFRSEFRHDFLPQFPLQSVDDDTGSFRNTSPGDGSTDSGAAPRHDDYFVLQTHGRILNAERRLSMVD